MTKLFGLVLMLLGLALIVVKFVFKSFFDEIPFLASLKPAYVIIAGLVLIAAGFFFLKSKKKTQAGEELPIYRGKEIVGYRRV